MKINDYMLRNFDEFPEECELVNKNYKIMIDALKKFAKAKVNTEMADDIAAHIKAFERYRDSDSVEITDIKAWTKLTRYSLGCNAVITNTVSLLSMNDDCLNQAKAINNAIADGFSASVDLYFTYKHVGYKYEQTHYIQQRRFNGLKDRVSKPSAVIQSMITKLAE